MLPRTTKVQEFEKLPTELSTAAGDKSGRTRQTVKSAILLERLPRTVSSELLERSESPEENCSSKTTSEKEESKAEQYPARSLSP